MNYKVFAAYNVGGAVLWSVLLTGPPPPLPLLFPFVFANEVCTLPFRCVNVFWCET